MDEKSSDFELSKASNKQQHPLLPSNTQQQLKKEKKKEGTLHAHPLHPPHCPRRTAGIPGIAAPQTGT
jgi:hypothetical protein